jgi:hypothetical protein
LVEGKMKRSATLAAVLAPILWLSHMYVTPTMFSVIWHWPESSLVNSVQPILTAIVVGIPFGAAFGLLPWRHPRFAAVSGSLAAIAFVVALAAYAFKLSGESFVWVGVTELVLFAIVFTAIAYRSNRLWLNIAIQRRIFLGATALVALTFIAWGGAHAYSEYLSAAVRAA